MAQQEINQPANTAPLTSGELEELRGLYQKGTITDQDLTSVKPFEANLIRSKGAAPPSLGLGGTSGQSAIGSRMPDLRPPSRDNEGLMGGEAENLFAMPGDLIGMIPTPYTKIGGSALSAIGGGVGGAIDAARNPEGFSVGQPIRGALRQGAMSLMGAGLEGPLARKTLQGYKTNLTKDAAEAALTPISWKQPLGPGVKLGSNEAGKETGVAFARKQAGDKITGRVNSFDPVANATPRSRLTQGTDNIISKTANSTMTERASEKALKSERRRMLNGGNPILTPNDVLAKKRGARATYPQDVKAEVTEGSKLLRRQVGNNAQARLEEIDAATAGNRSRRSGTLADLNQRSGGYEALHDALSSSSPGAGNALKRALIGSMVGAGGQLAYDNAVGNANGADNLQRYGPGGIAGAAAYGLFPTSMARLFRILGATGPNATRATVVAAKLREPKK